MNDFSERWIKDIITELNNANMQMPKEKGGGKWDISKFESEIEFIKSYVVFSASIYDFLNSKGLINRGFCPVTGDKIGYDHNYKFFDRIIYLSKQGVDEFKEYDRVKQIKLYGKEPMTDERKAELREKVELEVRERKNGKTMVWLLLIIFILYIIKQCSS